jgi:hypothetical protein
MQHECHQQVQLFRMGACWQCYLRIAKQLLASAGLLEDEGAGPLTAVVFGVLWRVQGRRVPRLLVCAVAVWQVRG